MLYRKYRPVKFSEVEGQEHIVQTLRGSLISGNVGHAYLFCGPRGTGKTTLARLFAKALNCEKLKPGAISGSSPEPCNLCSSCQEIGEGRSLDLIEIDAASNRGIDEIRNIKESARVASSGSRYKIFIVDEVHMLTQAAFNALLKTLEEPPPHIVFILATTEPHKLPETILSRVQRFDFKKLNSEIIKRKLTRIAKAENISIDDEAVNSIIQDAGGSLRDAESILTKLISYAGATITADLASEVLGIVPLITHEKLLSTLISKDTKKALDIIKDLHESGINLENFIAQFLRYLRKILIDLIEKSAASEQKGMDPAKIVSIIQTVTKAKNDLASSPIPQLPLELAIIEITKNETK
ncbi:MAG: DNA polymerase III subunit gamma/tau [Parcubacteria group bacterium Licking1014_17]|nr:MAG: DNA polymerase III subunit gamma/tau [Parcubacteria group bacterium Licking1014_17]